MAQVDVQINDQIYSIACDDGQEAHLARLAQYVDNRVGELVAAVGRRVGDSRLLVMASLLIADELSDAYGELETLRESNQGIAKRMEAEETLTGLLEGLADRLESIADRVEQD